jgi:hypothetical protein
MWNEGLRMNFDELLRKSKEWSDHRLKILEDRNHDYANGKAFANFQRLAGQCKSLKVDVTTPEGIAMFFVIHKINRVLNLLSGAGVPKGERLVDSIEDAQNYLDIARGIFEENNGEPSAHSPSG